MMKNALIYKKKMNYDKKKKKKKERCQLYTSTFLNMLTIFTYIKNKKNIFFGMQSRLEQYMLN